MQGGAHMMVMGASHHTTPISIRERLAVTNDRQPDFYHALRQIPGVHEAVLLNTCNRLELYAVVDNSGAEEEVERMICEFQSFPAEEFRQHRFLLRNDEALRHLLQVASGADSQLVGETEIFGQVKDAYARAGSYAGPGTVLNRVFQKAFQSAKYIRSHVPIGAGQVSVATVAVDLAEKIFGRLEDCRVLVAGTGEVGEKTVKALHSRGVTDITVLSRFAERAATLAATVGASSGTLDGLAAALPKHDIVIGCTVVTSPIINATMVQAAARQRRIRPLFLIDLGIPRNFEPATGDVDSVFVYDLDDLARIADENLATRRAAVDRCKHLAADKAVKIWEGVVPRLPATRTAPVGEAFASRQQATS